MSDINDFLKPRTVRVQSQTDNKARVVIEPFRAWLWPHAGQRPASRAAVQHARLCRHAGDIDGVLHEYTSIEGVQEDVVEILLNLKELAIRMHSRDRAELVLHKSGSGPVTAADIRRTTTLKW